MNTEDRISPGLLVSDRARLDSQFVKLDRVGADRYRKAGQSKRATSLAPF
jgi:hypothetical protein